MGRQKKRLRRKLAKQKRESQPLVVNAPDTTVIVQPPVVAPASQESSASSGDAPARPSPVLRGINKILNKVSAARESLFGSKVATESDNEIRKQYQKVVQQAILTQEIIKDNNKLLVEKSKEDKDLAVLLSEVAENKELRDVFNKVVSGQEVYGRELVQATEFMQRITTTLDKVGLSLEVNLPKVADSMMGFVQDSRIDVGARRDALEGIQKAVSKLSVKTDSIEELSKLQSDRINFTEEENKNIGRIFSQIRDDIATGKIKDAKLQGTIGDLNKTLSSVVLTNKEINGFLESTVEGTSMKDRLSSGLGAVQGGIKRGMLSSLFAAAGLPGLDLIVEDVADVFSGLGGLTDAFKGAGAGGKKVLGKAGGLAKGAGKFLGTTGGKIAGGALGGLVSFGAAYASGDSLGEAGAKGAGATVGGIAGGALGSLLGPVGTAVGGALGSYLGDLVGEKAYGFFAEGGMKKISDKISSGLAVVGDVYHEVESGVSSIVSKISGMFDMEKLTTTLTNGFNSLFGEDGIFGFAIKIIDKIMTFMEATPLGMIFKGAKALFGDMPMPAVAGGAQAVPQYVGNQAYEASVDKNRREKSFMESIAAGSGKDKVVVVQSPPQQNMRSPSRMTQVDDMGLSLMNSSFMDK